MKRLIIILLVAVGFSLSPLTNKVQAAAPYYAPPANITFQVFYDQLSPYGTWINNSNYGYVWVPAMGNNFIPYCSGGYWQYSDDFGWLWVSDYAWGWAPFHYGNWYFDDMYGWMWVPGYNWASAWVTWGSYNGYYGWAPMGPGYTFASGYRPPARYWNFVPYNRMYERNLYSYRYNNTTIVNNNITVINNTKVYNNQKYYSGPRREDVERNSGRRVTPVTVAETDRPGAARVENNRVSMYRPSVNREPAGARVTPNKVGTRESLKPVGSSSPNAERGAGKRGTTNTAQPGNAGEKISNDRQDPAGQRRVTEPVKEGTPRGRTTERSIPQQQPPTIDPSRKQGTERQMERRQPQNEKINNEPRQERQMPERKVGREEQQMNPQTQPRGVQRQEQQRQPETQQPQQQPRQERQQPKMRQERQQPQIQPQQPQGGGGQQPRLSPQRGKGGPR